MARNRKFEGGAHDLDAHHHKMYVRTENMRKGVRLGSCVLLLTLAVAFLTASMPHKRKLERLKMDLVEVQSLENSANGRVDAQERKLRAIETDPQYRELIARDCLNYYEPGEYIFRMEQ